MSTRIYGFHPVREALRHRPHDVLRVWLTTSRAGGQRPKGRKSEIETLCERHQVPVEQASEVLLAELGEAVHNGVIAELRAASIGQEQSDPQLVVLLEDIQDPRNLGALLRVCEGAGVGRVLIRDRGSAPLSPLAIKTSAGAAEWLSIERVTNSAQEIQRLKRESFWVYGADAGGVAAWDLDLSGPVVLCFGGEERGLRSRTRTLCDGLVSVPMRGRVGSLNVATAAAAVLFEAVRQRHGLSGAARHLPSDDRGLPQNG